MFRYKIRIRNRQYPPITWHLILFQPISSSLQPSRFFHYVHFTGKIKVAQLISGILLETENMVPITQPLPGSKATVIVLQFHCVCCSVVLAACLLIYSFWIFFHRKWSRIIVPVGCWRMSSLITALELAVQEFSLCYLLYCVVDCSSNCWFLWQMNIIKQLEFYTLLFRPMRLIHRINMRFRRYGTWISKSK